VEGGGGGGGGKRSLAWGSEVGSEHEGSDAGTVSSYYEEEETMANPLLAALNKQHQRSASSLSGRGGKAGGSLTQTDLLKKRQSVRELETVFRRRRGGGGGEMAEEANKDSIASTSTGKKQPHIAIESMTAYRGEAVAVISSDS
jgi:hypothetical protein